MAELLAIQEELVNGYDDVLASWLGAHAGVVETDVVRRA